MNAVRNELAQSDAPFLSTTVAAKHPVEQFRHFDTHDRQHIFSVTTKEAIVYAKFGQLSFLSGRVCVRSTLRRYAMATPASAHCMSRQLVFGDLSCTRFREGDVAPEEPSALHHPPHYLALEHRVLLLLLLGLHHLLLLDPLDSLKSPFVTRRGAPQRTETVDSHQSRHLSPSCR